MIYVTGEKDTMKDLKEMDEYKGLDYEEKLFMLNPSLSVSKGKPFLPPSTSFYPYFIGGQFCTFC